MIVVLLNTYLVILFILVKLKIVPFNLFWKISPVLVRYMIVVLNTYLVILFILVKLKIVPLTCSGSCRHSWSSCWCCSAS